MFGERKNCAKYFESLGIVFSCRTLALSSCTRYMLLYKALRALSTISVGAAAAVAVDHHQHHYATSHHSSIHTSVRPSIPSSVCQFMYLSALILQSVSSVWCFAIILNSIIVIIYNLRTASGMNVNAVLVSYCSCYK